MDTSSPKLKRRSPRRSASALMMTVVIAAFAGVVALLWELERDPVMNIPTHTVPSPNALDDFARAGKLIPDVNIVNGPGGRGVSRALGLSAATQNRVVRDNAPALAALRQGLTRPYMTPPERSSTATFDYVVDDRRLARLLALQADIQAAHGDWAASAQTSLDGMQLGEDVPRGGILIHMLVGVAIDAIVREPLMRSVDHLDLAGTRAALHRLQKIDANAQPYAPILQEEEWSMQAGLLEMYQKPNWRRDILQNGGFGTSPTDLKTRMAVAMTSKRQVMNNFTKYMDGQIAGARAHRPPTPFDYAAADPFLQVLAPIYTGTATRYHDNRTQNAFLEVELALHAYLLQHHQYPETLADLTPDLLPAVPGDPFAFGKPVRYQKTANSYVLYSVGPDGVDDGGKAIQDPNRRNGPKRPVVEPQNKGDVVAGVNF
ncbi:MAG: hypothetical protein ABIY70_04465 [Capsulimonas sp.]|uniref:hypothetical protein n=1 Tax=Capsulimonas sp. TaxID=2494211 RepID=UPI00326557E9